MRANTTASRRSFPRALDFRGAATIRDAAPVARSGYGEAHFRGRARYSEVLGSRARRSERVDSLIEDIEAYQLVARQVNARAAMYVPMLVQEQPVGLIVAVNKIEGDRFSDGDLRLAEAFADRAAIALDSSEHPRRPQTSRVRRQSDLTGRETEVIRLVALGLSNAEVAERLVVSPRTVHAHLRSIYRKLELTSRGAATRYAFEHDLI